MNSHPRNFLLRILKKEPVLSVSAVCMFFSMLFVPPSPAYAEYIDFRVLALLFSLMAVVAGLQRCDFFTRMAQLLLTGKKRRRPLFLTLILLPFFVSMLVTNDVALITFVPFAILILTLTGQQEYLVFLVVMQTVAANLGSMATPVGNPQNLYLYSRFGLSADSFFKTVLPFMLLALILTAASVLLCPDREFLISFPGTEKAGASSSFPEKKRLLLYLCLFVLCLLSVFHLLPYPILLLIVCTALLLADRSLYRTLDYGLLATFVCFFVFAGNIGAIPAVRHFLQQLLSSRPLLTSALTSQIISNVPAAVLLSGFTDNWKALLLGTDIGGLGTPIASLASLISFRLYMKTPNASAASFLSLFTLVNMTGLVLFLAAAYLAGIR